ncbi:thiamine pyrophosphate-dependent enzyme [Pseudonocardia sp. CA-107938]|uniref:thiamine pyrophosphate-dependent enzyme n=1 Tax=Pseudonocardia sp. CA-107938 TaxID=3240021 RepID=UPI003D8ADD1E
MTTVRDATFAVLRECGLNRIFANPGSTEIPFLLDLPDDLEFVLALHEASVVGMATGHALATDRPALVNLHTTAGLGNAVGALATARVNRAPLVVLVGQQDRRHLAQDPFLAGRLDGLAGTYPVWTHQPVQPHDVPGAIRRAWHEATLRHGPALVVVPADDWLVELDPELAAPSPPVVHRARPDAEPAVDDVVRMLEEAGNPVLIVGAGAADQASWDALVTLARQLDAPVWQEPFGARPGFPQDHPAFVGHLPTTRSQVREALAGHDVALVVGTCAVRQYTFEPGPALPPDLTVVVVSDDPDELLHSHAEVAVLAPPAAACAAISSRVTKRAWSGRRRPQDEPLPGGSLRAEHVFAALAERLPPNVVLVEETPSTRPALHRLLPARSPYGFVSAAMGGLGFGLPAAAGLKMGNPRRPVVAVLGDGSSMYAIQGLWSAVKYGCGVLYVVLSNGRYAVMDQLARQAGGKGPWPDFGDVDITDMARAFSCEAWHVDTPDQLVDALDEVVPTLAERNEPLLLDVLVPAK